MLILATVSAALCFDSFAATAPSVSILETADAGMAALYEPDGVRLGFSYGFDDTAKSGRLIPFDVEVTNDTDDTFTGTLVIGTRGVMEDGTGSVESAALEYIYPVEAAAREKNSIGVTISVPSQDGEVSLSLIDSAGICVAEDSAYIDLDKGRGRGVLIGILSDSPDRLEYFRNVSISGTGLSTRTVELNPGDLPQSASAYEQLDILVVSDLSMSGISQASLDAIEQWVSGGGVLIIGTGSRDEAAMSLARNVDELSISPLGRKSVNMGIKYSKTDDPDEATLELELSEIFAEDGLEVMQSDDIAMLMKVQHFSGVIAITAYDLCDLAGFCAEEAGYTEDVLVGALGTARIGELITYMDSSEEYYELAKSIVGVSDTPSASVLTPYIVAAFVFMLLIIFLSVYLRARGLEIFFHVFVLMAVFLTSAFIWLWGVRWRNPSLSVSYAYIREINDDFGQETGFIRTEASSAGEYSVSLRSDYEVYPIVYGADTAESSVLSGLETDGHIVISERDGDPVMGVSSARPFAGVLSEFSRALTEDGTGGIEADIRYFGGVLSGDITNNNDYTLSDVSILMYGELCRIGDMEPFSTVTLEDAATKAWPAGNAGSVAGMLIEEGEGSAMALRRERLLTYYIEDKLSYNFSGARIIAFADTSVTAPPISSDTRANVRGDMLLSVSTEIDTTDGIYIWKNCLQDEPGVISGDYDFITNSATGSCVLEYTLGSGMSISSLSFRGLSEDFEDDDIVPFDGAISFYNYETGSYDYIGSGEITLSQEEIGQYLSPGNTVIVRFTPTEEVLGAKIYLPVPSVTGIVGDNNA